MKRYRERGDAENAPNHGGLRKTTKRDDRHIVRDALSNRRQTLGELSANSVCTVSVRTLKRRLAEKHIKKWRAANRPLLKDEHAALRLAFAIEHRDWTAEDWKRAVWSDECSVEKSADPRQIWCFRTPDEKWLKDCIHGSRHSGRLSVMVWGSFAGEIPGPFRVVVGRITGASYLELIQEVLPNFLNEVYDTLQLDPIFMQDNAPVHTANIVKDWLNENDFEVFNWPPYSPDLNPIEHIWVELKRLLHQNFPDIANKTGDNDSYKQYLGECLEYCWRQIDDRVFWNLCQSMPRRMAAVIEAGGWYTRY
jgi:transposase